MYEALRHFADSWGLVFLTCVFVFVVVRTLWPRKDGAYKDAANIPLREDLDK